MTKRHTDAEYINAPLFDGDEADVACRTVAIRTARKQHTCYGATQSTKRHHINPGDRYRYEKALIDGSFWGEYRMCLGCMDRVIEGDL